MLLFGVFSFAQTNCTSGAPCYSAATITNGASFQVDALAPYTCASIFGTNLADATAGIPSLSPGAELLTSLGDASVLVGGIPAVLTYVSPEQINFIVPIVLLPSSAVTVQVIRKALAGPAVQVGLLSYAPALFLYDEQTVLTIKPDWSGVFTPDAPAQPGGLVILYATGLGNVTPALDDYDAPSVAVPINALNKFSVEINGVAVDASDIFYAGTAPPFPGVYQINLRLPQGAGPNPEIRISIAGAMSPEGFHIPVQ